MGSKRTPAPLLYSIDDARTILGGVGRTWIHMQISAGRLRTVKLGRRTMIPVADIEALVANGGGAISVTSQVGPLSGPVDLLTAEEAAALLEVSTRTLANWRVLSKGPTCIRLGERCIRYSRAELVKFIKPNGKTTEGGDAEVCHG